MKTKKSFMDFLSTSPETLAENLRVMPLEFTPDILQKIIQGFSP